MKNIILILSLFVNIINAQTQILPLETKGRRIEGAYYKDLNNELDPYIGTWEGKVNGNNFKVTFEKVRNEFGGTIRYWKDRLQGKYEMRDAMGNVLYSTYNIPNVKLRSYGFWKNKTELRLGFVDACIVGDIYLKFTDSTKRQLEWKYIADTQIVAIIEGKKEPDCAKINEMPQERFILTKKVEVHTPITPQFPQELGDDKK